jgi:hypothetical protein
MRIKYTSFKNDERIESETVPWNEDPNGWNVGDILNVMLSTAAQEARRFDALPGHAFYGTTLHMLQDHDAA